MAYDLPTYAENLIKDIYTQPIIDAAKWRSVLTGYLEAKQQVENIGATARVDVKKTWVESIAVSAAYTSLVPTALNPEYDHFDITTKKILGSLLFYFEEKTFTDESRKAVLNVVQDKTSSIAKALRAEKEIMNFGDGGVTPRCICTAASNSSGIVTLTCDSTRWLRVGMPVDFKESNASAITSGTGVQVKSISSDGVTFTVDVTSALGAAFATAAADAYVFHASGKDGEPYGLEALIGKTNITIFGKNRATAGNECYLPNVYKILSGALTATTDRTTAGGTMSDWDSTILHQLIELQINQYDASQDALMIFTTPTIRSKMILDNRNLGIAMPLQRKIDGWPEKVVEFDGVPVVASFKCQLGTMFIPDMSTFTLYRTYNFQWDSPMWKEVYDQATAKLVDAKQAFFRERYELAVGDPTKSATLYCVKGAY